VARIAGEAAKVFAIAPILAVLPEIEWSANASADTNESIEHLAWPTPVSDIVVIPTVQVADVKGPEVNDAAYMLDEAAINSGRRGRIAVLLSAPSLP
jgi:hypothetical protein